MSKIDEAGFQHDMAYRDFKDLARRTASNNLLRDKALSITKNPKYDGIKEALLQWFINFLIKSFWWSS